MGCDNTSGRRAAPKKSLLLHTLRSLPQGCRLGRFGTAGGALKISTPTYLAMVPSGVVYSLTCIPCGCFETLTGALRIPTPTYLAIATSELPSLLIFIPCGRFGTAGGALKIPTPSYLLADPQECGRWLRAGSGLVSLRPLPQGCRLS